MYQISKFHVEKDIHRHWCPYSEPFTGGDALESALAQDWAIVGSIFVENFDLRESRKVTVYHVRLQKDAHFRLMRVITNPYVEQVIASCGCPVEQYMDAIQA